MAKRQTFDLSTFRYNLKARVYTTSDLISLSAADSQRRRVPESVERERLLASSGRIEMHIFAKSKFVGDGRIAQFSPSNAHLILTINGGIEQQPLTIRAGNSYTTVYTRGIYEGSASTSYETCFAFDVHGAVHSAKITVIGLRGDTFNKEIPAELLD